MQVDRRCPAAACCPPSDITHRLREAIKDRDRLEGQRSEGEAMLRLI
jgi:hypothetical protein